MTAQKTTAEKINRMNEQLMLLFINDPNVDWKFLSDMTGGLIEKGATVGNGMDAAKAIAIYNRRLSETKAPVKRGRKPGAKAAKPEKKANGGVKRTRTRKVAAPSVPGAPAKRRGRPPKSAAAPVAPIPAPVTPIVE